MSVVSLLHVLAALFLSPLLVGIINRVKAFFGGRQGRPLLQPYYDIARYMKKGAVYSSTTTWIFRMGPVVGLAAVTTALLLLPFGGTEGTFSFRGDLILFAYLLGVARFFTVLAAMDTGSAFEGMGASREVTFSALAEPALLLGMMVLTRQSGSFSLTGMYADAAPAWVASASAMTLVCAAVFLVSLAENARIPVDDPTTHLELTMIHEVMVLDHSGPDFGMITYAAALKLWLYGALLVGLLVPVGLFHGAFQFAVALVGMGLFAILVGVIESGMARLKLTRVPQFLTGALACSVVALALAVRT